MMGPLLLVLCAFLCAFHQFACGRHGIARDAEWSGEPARAVAVPPVPDRGDVLSARGFPGMENTERRSPLPWPYLDLPVYLHSVAPVFNKELLKPARVTGREPMPEILKRVLLADAPRGTEKPIGPSVSRGLKAVDLSCKFKKMRVRVRRKYLSSSAKASDLSLGTCPVSNDTDNFFFFCYDVSKCGSNKTIINDRVVYSNTLRYTPEAPKSLVRTAVPFNLPIFCHYNRFYYSYKIGYLPEIKPHQFFRSMQPSSDFTLTASNAQWERLPAMHEYVIGSPMYFEARSPPLSEDQRLFISFCFATPSQKLSSTLRFMVIENYGCMSHNKGIGSRSRFIRHERNTLRFEVEAFIFEGVADERLHMHCEMFVADHFPTEITKSCNYNSTAGRWEELYGDIRVCSCCNSVCNASASPAALPATKKMVTSGSWSNGGVVGEATVEWDETTRPETKSTRPETKSTRPETKSTRPETKSTRPETKSVTEAMATTVTETTMETTTETTTETTMETDSEIGSWAWPETAEEADLEQWGWSETESAEEVQPEIRRWIEPKTTMQPDTQSAEEEVKPKIRGWIEPKTTMQTDTESAEKEVEPKNGGWIESKTTMQTDTESWRWPETESADEVKPEIRRWTQPATTIQTDTEIRRWIEPKTTIETDTEIRRRTRPDPTMQTDTKSWGWSETETAEETDAEIRRWTQPTTAMQTNAEIRRRTRPPITMQTDTEIRRRTRPGPTMEADTESWRWSEMETSEEADTQIRRRTWPGATVESVEAVVAPAVKRRPDKVPKVKGSAAKVSESGSVPRLMFKEVFGIP